MNPNYDTHLTPENNIGDELDTTSNLFHHYPAVTSAHVSSRRKSRKSRALPSRIVSSDAAPTKYDDEFTATYQVDSARARVSVALNHDEKEFTQRYKHASSVPQVGTTRKQLAMAKMNQNMSSSLSTPKIIRTPNGRYRKTPSSAPNNVKSFFPTSVQPIKSSSCNPSRKISDLCKSSQTKRLEGTFVENSTSSHRSLNNFQKLPFVQIQIITEPVKNEKPNASDLISPLTCFSPTFTFQHQISDDNKALHNETEDSEPLRQSESEQLTRVDDKNHPISLQNTTSNDLQNKVALKESFTYVVADDEPPLDSYDGEYTAAGFCKNASSTIVVSTLREKEGLSFDNLSNIDLDTDESSSLAHECNNVNSKNNSTLPFFSPSEGFGSTTLSNHGERISSSQFKENALCKISSASKETNQLLDDSTIGGFESAVGEFSYNGTSSANSRNFSKLLHSSKVRDGHSSPNILLADTIHLVDAMSLKNDPCPFDEFEELLDIRMLRSSTQLHNGISTDFIESTIDHDRSQLNTTAYSNHDCVCIDSLRQTSSYSPESECPNLHQAMEIFRSTNDFDFRKDDEGSTNGEEAPVTSSYSVENEYPNLHQAMEIFGSSSDFIVENDGVDAINCELDEKMLGLNVQSEGTLLSSSAASSDEELLAIRTNNSVSQIATNVVPEAQISSLEKEECKFTEDDAFVVDEYNNSPAIDWRNSFSPCYKPRRKRSCKRVSVSDDCITTVENVACSEDDNTVVKIITTHLNEDRVDDDDGKNHQNSIMLKQEESPIDRKVEDKENFPSTSLYTSEIEDQHEQKSSPSSPNYNSYLQKQPKLHGKTILFCVPENEESDDNEIDDKTQEQSSTNDNNNHNHNMMMIVIDCNVYENILIEKKQLETRLYEMKSDFESRSKPIETAFEDLRKLRIETMKLRSESIKSREIIPKALGTIQDLTQTLDRFKTRIHELELQNQMLEKQLQESRNETRIL